MIVTVALAMTLRSSALQPLALVSVQWRNRAWTRALAELEPAAGVSVFLLMPL
jgi:hypothetical protein